MLPGMSVPTRWLAVCCVLAATHVLLAAPAPTEKSKQPVKTEQPATDTANQAATDKRALMRQLRDEREKKVRERGEIFAKITTKKDYSGEYVLFRDQDVTAFLDLKDPQHPRYSKAEHDDDVPAGSKPPSHILVVPNQPRETIGKTVASDITAEDLELTLKVMREAAVLAKKYGFKDPKIFVKSPERVGIGYLHVHVVGDRDPKVAYPSALH